MVESIISTAGVVWCIMMMMIMIYKLLLRDGWPTKGDMLSPAAIIFSKLTIDSLEQVVKYVQS